MPEGDSILRAARALAARLDGKTLAEGSSPALVGKRVVKVEAQGKNLLVHFDDGRALRTHLRMTGSWDVYARGERWRRPAHRARAVLATDDAVCVCFAAPVVEMVPSARSLGLGPDVLAPDFDAAAAVARLRTRPDLPIGEALLAQALVAGIGNIYKSETLFLERVSPFVTVAELDDARLAALLARARRLMLRSVIAPAGGRRTTSGAARGFGRYNVYKRTGLPCPHCGGKIAVERQGPRETARTTYYCPSCQAA